MKEISKKQKMKARKLTNGAVRRGELVKTPCEKCGNPKVDAHHVDYFDHMNIMWLCRKHHFDQHPNHHRNIVYKRWRKKKGITLEVFVKPIADTDKISATLYIEGEVYYAEGKTHTEAMLNVTNLVNEKKLSLEK